MLSVVVHAPFLQRAFGTYDLPPADWALAAAVAFTIVPVLEVLKWIVRRGWLGDADLGVPPRPAADRGVSGRAAA
jgi:Ca2+-transporting ATPase